MNLDTLSAGQRLLVTGITAALLPIALFALVSKPFAAHRDRLTAHVGSAGQGLTTSSPVKLRGVTVGRVAAIDLDPSGGAIVTLRMNPGFKVADTVTAAVNPESVFGPKFVDLVPGAHEAGGPFLADGALAETTESGDLNQLLVDTDLALTAIDPTDVAVILDALGQGLGGQGRHLHDLIGSSATLVQIANDNRERARLFAADLARLARLRGVGDDLGNSLQSSTDVLDTLASGHNRLQRTAANVAQTATTLAHGFTAYGDDLGAGVRSAENATRLLYANLGLAGPTVRAVLDLLPLYRAVGWQPGPGTKHLFSVQVMVSSDPCQLLLGLCPKGSNSPGTGRT